MAHFFKRKKTWYYSIDIGKDQNGKRKKQKRGGFRTKKEPQEAAALIQTDLSHNIFVLEKDTTFRDFAQDWLKI